MTDKFTHPRDAKEGHKWRTNGGVDVDALHYFPEAKGDNIAAVINGNMDAFNDDGFYLAGSNFYRLIDAPGQHEVWVNLDADGYMAARYSKEDADNRSNSDRIACQKFTITEGRFDDEK